MKNHRHKARLRVEELESRLVPSQGTPWPYPTSNWSGYSIDTAAKAVTDVQGTWTVPTVTVSGRSTEYAATWVGIDGDNSSTVEQIGTDSDQVSGKASYYAWYEMYPAYPVYLDGKKGDPPALSIHPGDTIFADVNYNGSAFVLTITDETDIANSIYGSYTSPPLTLASAQRSSAEWIVEAPSSGNSVLTLDNFGSETFTGAQATISGTTGTIGYFASPTVTNAVVYQIDIASYNRRTQTYTYTDTTGPLSTVGDSFTVNYGTTAPAAPTNGPALTYGSMTPTPLAISSAATGSSSLPVAVISQPTANPSTFGPALANPITFESASIAQSASFNQPVAAGTLNATVSSGADASGYPGVTLTWFGLTNALDTTDPLTLIPVIVTTPPSSPNDGDLDAGAGSAAPDGGSDD
jgi:hypothetical protein